MPWTNLVAEVYIQIFYSIDKRDILTIECKMIISGPKSMRKVDGLSLNFIDFYVLLHHTTPQ
jgi:hypothetical protein